MEIAFNLGMDADLPNSLSLNNLVIVILLSRLCDIETRFNHCGLITVERQ